MQAYNTSSLHMSHQQAHLFIPRRKLGPRSEASFGSWSDILSGACSLVIFRSSPEFVDRDDCDRFFSSSNSSADEELPTVPNVGSSARNLTRPEVIKRLSCTSFDARTLTRFKSRMRRMVRHKAQITARASMLRTIYQ